MAGPIRISILANGAQARREAAATAKSYGGLGRAIRRGGAIVGLTSLGAAAVGLAKKSVDLEAKFSQTMNTIAAATGATGGEITKLNDLAIKLGADTSFSANEAADAMLELAKAGVSTSDIMGGTLAGTLQLAAAGGTELGTAATIASNAMNAFTLQGKDMASVAATLAGGANASSASVESLGQGLSQVGAGAVNAGLSLQQTVGALSAFDAAGIKGSDAGTSLKTMLQRLVPQTTKARDAMDELGLKFVNADGSFRGLATVAEQLKKRLSGLSEEQRTQALNTIFGSDASRAATVLMRQGADGLRKYIRATRDQGAAQKMADARMKGTAGALERLGGAVETAQLRIGQELAPVVAKVADSLGDNLGPAVETVIDGAKDLGKAVAPAVEGIISVLDELIPSAEGAGSAFNDKLLPAVREVSDIVAAATGFIDDLPGPIKSIGIQAGIAALVLPRLTASIVGATTAMKNGATYAQVLGLELRDASTRGKLAQTAMTKLSGAAKTAAGIGGMVALTNGVQDANTQVGKLLTLVGGAATGFSVGGPVGAIVGLVGSGVFLRLKRQVAEGSDSFRDAYGAAGDYAASLDRVSGAITRVTRAEVSKQLQDKGAFTLAGQLGISTRDLTRSMLGNEAASARVTRAIQKQSGVSDVTVDSLGNVTVTQGKLAGQAAELAGILGIESDALQKSQARTRELSVASGELFRSLKGVQGRGKIVTRVESRGFPETARQVARLTRGLNLTPKQIRTIIKQTGANATVKDVQRVRRSLADVGKVRPNLKPAEDAVSRSTRRMEGAASRGGKQVGDKLRDGTAKAKPNLNPFTRMFAGDLSGLQGRATSGGSSIGGNLGSGINAGIGVWVGPIAATAARAVRAAVAAAKAAAAIKSPSRVMRDEVGAQLGAGLVIGLRAKEGAAKNGGRRIIRNLTRGVDNGREGISKVLDRITDLIEKKLDGKKQAGRRKALLASLRDERRELLRNGKAQEKVNRQLEQWKNKLKAAQEYAANIKRSFVDYGSVVGLGAVDGSTTVVSLKGLLSQLTARADAAGRFSALIKQLRKDGLNKTSVQQLLDAGVEGGLATAEAIASGGRAALTQINQLTAQIGSTGGKLGNKMADSMRKVGLSAAQGMVDGLKKKQRDLDKVAERLATSLVKRVKKALGIKSPSRVFRSIGDNTVRGLALGLDETHVRRQGEQLAKSLTGGFGTPSLDAAYARAGGAAGRSGGITVTLTAEEVSQLQRGRQIRLDLDAYDRAGGRKAG